MAGKINKFQVLEAQSWMGLTKENHLGAIFQRAPQKASNIMVQLLAANRGKTLNSLLSEFPTKEFESDDEYTWNVLGSSRRNIPLIECRDEAGNTVDADYTGNVGAGTAPFQLVFAENWFPDGVFIVGSMNELYQFRVLGNARPEGTNYVVTVELGGGNMEGCPAELLLPGERFSIEAAYIEKELSRKVGDRLYVTVQLIAA